MGPFFAAEVHPPGAQPGAGWQPMAELLAADGAEAASPLRERVDAVALALAQRRPAAGAAQRAGSRAGGAATGLTGHRGRVEPRVAASVTQLGLVARVLAPAVAVAALHAGRLRLGADSLWWRPQLGGPFPLSVSLAAGGGDLDGSLVEELTEVMAAGFGVSPHVLWGNVGSALNSAARLVGSAHPQLAGAAGAAADAMLADPRIDGGLLRAGPGFRRRSCCLIYRVGVDVRGANAAAVCGDCVLGIRG